MRKFPDLANFCLSVFFLFLCNFIIIIPSSVTPTLLVEGRLQAGCCSSATLEEEEILRDPNHVQEIVDDSDGLQGLQVEPTLELGEDFSEPTPELGEYFSSARDGFHDEGEVITPKTMAATPLVHPSPLVEPLPIVYPSFKQPNPLVIFVGNRMGNSINIALVFTSGSVTTMYTLQPVAERGNSMNGLDLRLWEPVSLIGLRSGQANFV